LKTQFTSSKPQPQNPIEQEVEKLKTQVNSGKKVQSEIDQELAELKAKFLGNG
jgi:phage shock protein A